MQFDKSEIGEPATEAEMGEVMRSLYGAAAGRPGKRVFAESAEQLQLEEGEAGPSAAIGGPSPARPALAAVQRPAAAKPAAAAPDALAALDARLGGRLGAGAVTHTGFGSAPGATVTAAPAAAERRVASASGGALMPPPAPRPVAQPPAAAQHVGEPAAKPAAKRPRAEAAPGGGATAAQSMLLSVPKAQPELRVQMGRAPALLGAAAGAAVELRVSNKERGAGGVPQAELCCSRGGSEAWRDVVGGAHVVAAAGTPHFCAAATADGQLLLYSAAGRRLAAPLKLGAGIVLLAAGAGWRLLALTSSGAVRLLDVERLEQVLEAGAGPLLEGGASVLDARLSRSGAPILTLSDCRAFVWHAGLRAWMCAADDSLAASQYAPLLRLADQGELSALQAEALAGGPSGLSGSGGGGGSSSGASAAQRALSRAHVEGSLAAAAALRSPDEYRRWLVTYARCLAEAGDAGRLSELCDSLAGPAPGEEPVEGEEEGGAQGEPADGARAPPRWCPTVLGLSKRALLRGEVLREVARNRSLGTLLQRCRQVLDAVEAAEADGADGDAAASP
jgi:protein HIRA/HIR1